MRIVYVLRAAAVAAALAAPGAGPGRAAAAEGAALYPVVRDGKWGYMDGTGKVAIEPQYACAWDFSDGLAAVQVGQRRGFVDAGGKMVIKPSYPMTWGFSDGLAAVFVGGVMFGKAMDLRNSGKWGYIDRTGTLKFECSAATDFREGKAFVYEGPGGGRQAWSIVDTGGKALARGMKFSSAAMVRGFSEGLAAVGKGGDRSRPAMWGYIDPTGGVAIAHAFLGAGDFRDGLAPVGFPGPGATNAVGGRADRAVNAKWGYIDRGGKAVIEGRYDWAGSFSDGLAAVRVEGKWGYINKSGATVIQPAFEFAAPFSCGFGRVAAGGKNGFVNAAGKVVVEPKFDVAWDFREGLARVETGGKQGYIDGTGRYVWAPTR
jgi:hypothetical protein